MRGGRRYGGAGRGTSGRLTGGVLVGRGTSDTDSNLRRARSEGNCSRLAPESKRAAQTIGPNPSCRHSRAIRTLGKVVVSAVIDEHGKRGGSARFSGHKMMIPADEGGCK